MKKREREPRRTRRNAFLTSAVLLVTFPFTQVDVPTAGRALTDLVGGTVSCPVDDNAIPEAMVIADAGMDIRKSPVGPNVMTDRTLNAAAIQYVERVYRNQAPEFVVMLNNDQFSQVNRLYKNRFRNLVNYYSHKAFTVPEQAFVFSNAPTTTTGIDDLEKIIGSNHIHNIEWVAWPNQNRGAMELCHRNISTSTLNVDTVLGTHVSNITRNQGEIDPFKKWRVQTSEKFKTFMMPWVLHDQLPQIK
jgi:hypothetical protein